ncbi:adenosylcobinamide-GDP ribazoletransferase [Herbidospora sp. NBRC 101105]|uniref:adenosylcobinamide-GDP ribazoletransferase n=1 Tax=Herbidospora sp. NBRC 101105 TaxID=3032195 RepID=UPI0024A41324|nr:adenosylcobinamide-GDP ribazoletransferase [Herbidospora sp. NBRC 101105]GLX92563.1 adenosylcobinamide-GDP ribazoletransferase [Herbidospora sp. NBRC 101105]
MTLRNWGNAWWLAVSLLSVLPVPRHSPVDSRTAGRAMVLGPLVGVLLGVIAALVFQGARWLGLGGTTAGLLAVGTLASLTRALHLDGLADLADGLGSRKSAPEALAIMKRSDIGPFGVVALIFCVGLQVSALSQVGPHALWTLPVAVATGRLAVTWACTPRFRAAREEGLGSLVAGTVRVPEALASTGTLLIVAMIAFRDVPVLVSAVPIGLAVAWVILATAVGRLGGITGDVLGALAEVATAACLLASAVTFTDL